MADEKIKYGKGLNPNSMKNLKKIPKGTVLNPLGWHAHNQAKKDLKRITHAYLEEVVHAAFMGDMAQLIAIVKDKTSEPIKVGVASSILVAIKKGDWKTLNEILERVIGKVPENINLAASFAGKPQVVISLPDNGRTIDVTPDDRSE
jgi:hypothetical protein